MINWNPYEAICFDLDGTLINTKGSISKAVNLTLQFFNYKEIDTNTIISFVGDGVKILWQRIFEYLNIDILRLDEF